MSELADVRGQESAKRALEIAAAGGHHLLLVGPPGVGKTLLAERLPDLLPPLEDGSPRPFRRPPTTISTTALVGGGRPATPGEVTLADQGVLFLDELAEFRREALAALRRPLDRGFVEVVRLGDRRCFPARFQLVAAMNPCPCGHRGDPRDECRCTAAGVERYRNRISGALLDRIDLHVEMPAVSLSEIHSMPGETSQAVAMRVARARDVQRERFGDGAESPLNAAMGPEAVRRYCALDARGRRLLDSAYERLGLSARARHRILKVARTLADLAGKETVEAGHVAEAVQYRSLDRRVDE